MTWCLPFSCQWGIVMFARLLLLAKLAHLYSPIYQQRLHISRALLRSANQSLTPTGRNVPLPQFNTHLFLKLEYERNTDSNHFEILVHDCDLICVLSLIVQVCSAPVSSYFHPLHLQYSHMRLLSLRL